MNQIKLAEAIKKMKQVNASRNQVYSVVRKFKGRYVVLIGGSGSGKSYEIADRLSERVENEPDARMLGVRAHRTDVTKSQFPLLKSRTKRMNSFDKPKESNGDEEIRHSNGGKILFSGLDDVEKLKSIFDISSVWIEEADQVTEKDVNELDRRLRGYNGLMQIYITFNPVSNLSYINKKYFKNRYKKVITKDKHGNKVEKIINRTLTIRGVVPFEDFPYYKDEPITQEQLDKKIIIWDPEENEGEGAWVEEYYYDTLIVHSTYRDNKFIDSQYRAVMKRLSEDDPEEYEIYGLGAWGVPGGTYFNKKSINAQINKNIEPLYRGTFTYRYEGQMIIDSSIGFELDEEGPICIYELPKSRYPYVIGGDTAGDGSDWNTAMAINNITGEDAASIRVNFDEDLYARLVYCLGKFYGELNDCNKNALAAIEINYSTHPLKELMRLGYDNIYIREASDDDMNQSNKRKYGFRTTGTRVGTGTRPVMLGMLRQIVREFPEKIKDKVLLSEMTTFVKNEKTGKPEAAPGFHDDMVLCRAIGTYASEQGETSLTPIEKQQQQLPHELQGRNDKEEEYVEW